MSAAEMRGLILRWIDTGEWFALHDALLEQGYSDMAFHARMCSSAMLRRGCVITAALNGGKLLFGEAVTLQSWLSAQKDPTAIPSSGVHNSR